MEYVIIGLILVVIILLIVLICKKNNNSEMYIKFPNETLEFIKNNNI